MRAFYNDTERFACDWLQRLMDAGLIMPGVIDDRSIADVSPDDVAGFGRVHLFAGIAGWDLALQLADWPEADPVWTCSCPCPPFSQAGKRQRCPGCASTNLVWCPRRTGYCICADCSHAWPADARHLWPEAWRLIARCRPPVVFGEQVASADGLGWLAGVRASLEILSYAPWGTDYPSAGVGSPNIRQRLWWVADTNGGSIGNGRLQSSGEHGQQPEDGRAGGLAHAGRASLQRELGYRENGRAHQALEGEGHQRERGGLHAGLGGAVGRLADPLRDGTRREPPSRSEPKSSTISRDGHSSGAGAEPWSGGAVDGLGNADGGRPGQRPRHGAQGHGRAELVPDDTGAPDRMGDANDAGSQDRSRGPQQQPSAQGRQTTQRFAGLSGIDRPWSRYDIAHCTDGKARRIPQSALQRLAAGLSDGMVPSGFAGAEGFPLAEGAQNRVGRLKGYGNSINPYAAAEFIRTWREVRAA